MDIKQLLEIGAQAFMSSLNNKEASGLSMGKVAEAMAGLMPGKGSTMDLAALIAQMNSSGLADMAQSWLSGGGNQSIDAGQILTLFGQDKIKNFANQLGLGETSAVSGLQAALPNMIDQASQDGTLKSLSSVSEIMGMAGKLFGK